MNPTLQPLNRARMIERLQKTQNFDVVVIGGGATGLGVALDAATRGLKVALFDAQDFAAGTSSRSTKLIHGGVRYLSNPRDWSLIQEALYERRLLINNAPELVRAQRFVVPCYSWLKALWYGAGLSLYGLFSSGGKGIRGVSVAGANAALGLLPGVVRNRLKAILAYSDAQFDDAALAVSLLQTAVAYGAVALNYMPVTGIANDGRRITGLTVKDEETGQTFEIGAKVVFNCAGVWVDSVRRLADPAVGDLVRISRGSHLVVDKSFLPTGNAMVIPKTSDGRVLFCIPWQDNLLIGTTDIEQGQAYRDPEPSPDEIKFMLDNANRYLTRRIRPEDIKAMFAGLRPLFSPKKSGLNQGTANMTRGWAVVPEYKNLLTVAGGKWTAYRAMAEAALKTAQQLQLLPRGGCMTRSLPLIVHDRLGQEDLQKELLKADKYDQQIGRRLLAFVRYCVEYTGARTAKDVLYRRLRIGELDSARTKVLMPVVEAMIARLKKA